MLTAVRAWVYSDDHACEAEVDLGEYLAHANAGDLQAIAAAGFGPGRATDEIASFFQQRDPAVAEVLAYCAGRVAQGAEVGYCVSVDEAAMRAWVAVHHPGLVLVDVFALIAAGLPVPQSA